MPAPTPPAHSRLLRFHAHDTRALVDSLWDLHAALAVPHLDARTRAAVAEKARDARRLAEVGAFTEVSTVVDAIERGVATTEPGALRDAVAHALASLREVGESAVRDRPTLEPELLLVTTDDTLVDEMGPALAGSAFQLTLAKDERSMRAAVANAHLVFFHARSPEVDGLQIQRLRARTRVPPLAFVVDDASIPARAAAARAGANLFLARPLGALGILAAARQLLSLGDVAPPRVVLLDPDVERASALATALESHGLPTCRVDDLAALDETLRLVDPDALVVHGPLAGTDAGDLCRMLRSSADWQRLPIFVCLGEADADERIRAIEEGADDATSGLPPVELATRIRARSRQVRMQREHASYDGMTGLLARGTFLDAAGAHLVEARRAWQPLAVGMLRTGEAGSSAAHLQAALTRTAALLHVRFRAPHLIARWSARDLAVLVTGDVARTLRAELDELRVRLEQDFVWRRLPEVSVAVATMPDDGITLPVLLREALARL